VENDMRPCLVLTTWPADPSVGALARGLIEARLAACVHVLPEGRSTYRWDGGVEAAAEQQIVIKTTRARVTALEAHVRSLHPYELPEWLIVDTEGSAAYAGWIAASVAGPEGETR
jgi:periplasmic divalent cation tolerance protein